VTKLKLVFLALLLILVLSVGITYFFVSKKIALAREQHAQEIFDQMKNITFGDTSLPVTQSYPELEDMRELLQYPTLTLEKIDIYKDGGGIDGLKLRFKEGLETPLFKTEWGRDNPERLDQKSLDLDSKVTKVSVYESLKTFI